MKKYLRFIEQVRSINDQYDLTRHEIAILDLSANRYILNEPITVGELIRQGEIASQVTLHTAFKALVSKKLLTTKCVDEDARIKQVVLTTAAFERYKNLDSAISQF